MAKPSTFPILYNDALKVKMSDLKKWGYLKIGTSASTTITWSRKTYFGEWYVRGKIGIAVIMQDSSPYVILEYTFNGEPRKQVVYLTKRESNLGKGAIWFFICPVTFKLCRNLYSVAGNFRHREAFNGCLYDCQTKSKKWRLMERIYGAALDRENLYEQLYTKHLKKQYAGKPTKKYSKLVRLLQKSESISLEEIERVMIMGV